MRQPHQKKMTTLPFPSPFSLPFSLCLDVEELDVHVRAVRQCSASGRSLHIEGDADNDGEDSDAANNRAGNEASVGRGGGRRGGGGRRDGVEDGVVAVEVAVHLHVPAGRRLVLMGGDVGDVEEAAGDDLAAGVEDVAGDDGRADRVESALSALVDVGGGDAADLGVVEGPVEEVGGVLDAGVGALNIEPAAHQRLHVAGRGAHAGGDGGGALGERGAGDLADGDVAAGSRAGRERVGREVEEAAVASLAPGVLHNPPEIVTSGGTRAGTSAGTSTSAGLAADLLEHDIEVVGGGGLRGIGGRRRGGGDGGRVDPADDGDGVVDGTRAVAVEGGRAARGERVPVVHKVLASVDGDGDRAVVDEPGLHRGLQLGEGLALAEVLRLHGIGCQGVEGVALVAAGGVEARAAVVGSVLHAAGLGKGQAAARAGVLAEADAALLAEVAHDLAGDAAITRVVAVRLVRVDVHDTQGELRREALQRLRLGLQAGRCAKGERGREGIAAAALALVEDGRRTRGRGVGVGAGAGVVEEQLALRKHTCSDLQQKQKQGRQRDLGHGCGSGKKVCL
eukprot:m.10125 g.10125  ORF g.10125 m.10125 type:complete len:565 (+) comp5130_c0_seq1:143-1837(+)